jgi:hypothetical protein
VRDFIAQQKSHCGAFATLFQNCATLRQSLVVMNCRHRGFHRMSRIMEPEQMLDWYGCPLPGVFYGLSEFHELINADEREVAYWINESGHPDYEMPYLVVSERTESETYVTVYDSRYDPPQPV